MYTIKHFLLAGALSLGSLAAMAEESAVDDPQHLREEIRERKEEIREDRRELRELERARRQRMRPGPVWVNLGLNASHVDQAAVNGFGGQGGISFGRKLMVRVQHSEITYESDEPLDDSGGFFEFDDPFFGPQQGSDTSVLAGFVLGRSGFFLAGGPSWVDIERTTPGAWGGDTGTRYELGWNSRQPLNAPVGFELVLFKNENDIRDFHGVALNLVFGPRVDGPQPKAGKKRRA